MVAPPWFKVFFPGPIGNELAAAAGFDGVPEVRAVKNAFRSLTVDQSDEFQIYDHGIMTMD
jgi:hypothetical protein